MNHTRLTVAAILAGAMLTLAGPALAESTTPAPPAAASAGQGHRLDAAKARCTEAIDRRISTLGRLDSAAARSRALTGEHRATLTALLGDAKRGLDALKPQVAAATDTDELRAACEPVGPAFRVYRLRVPQTWTVIAIDTAGAAATRLGSAADRIDSAIAEARAAGKDTAAADAALATMRARTAEGIGLLAGDADAVLAISPEQFDANPAVLTPYRSDLTSARAAFRAAFQAGRSAVEALRTA